jgi:hypothetical protein
LTLVPEKAYKAWCEWKVMALVSFDVKGVM